MSLSDLGDPRTLALEPDEPLEAIEGDPRAFIRELHGDDRVEGGVWEVTPGEFAWDNEGFAEHMHVLVGEATVTSDDGSTIELRPGRIFVTPSDWRGRWQVRQTLRKVYVVWKP